MSSCAAWIRVLPSAGLPDGLRAELTRGKWPHNRSLTLSRRQREESASIPPKFFFLRSPRRLRESLLSSGRIELASRRCHRGSVWRVVCGRKKPNFKLRQDRWASSRRFQEHPASALDYAGLAGGRGLILATGASITIVRSSRACSTRGCPVCRPASMSGISVEIRNISSAWRKTISPASGQADVPAAPREQRPAKRVDVLMVQLACPAKVQRDPQQIWPSASQGQSSWSGEGLGATTWRGFLLVPRAAELNLGGWVAGRSVEPGWTLPRPGKEGDGWFASAAGSRDHRGELALSRKAVKGTERPLDEQASTRRAERPEDRS